MDYKKKYNEAFKRAKEKYAMFEGMKQGDVLEDVFPEFKDSSDEEIRKEIKKDAEAWYKEHYEGSNPQGRSIVIGAYVDGAVTWLKKQGEQKPATMSLDEAIEHCKEKSCSNNACALEHKQLAQWLKELKGYKEQKTAWSEEDKTMIENIIDTINMSIEDCDVDDIGTNARFSLEKERDWLKSLKSRVQPKVELTQLDKNILEAAIAFVEQNNHFNCWRGVDKHTVLSALHSLRYWNQWKPSKAQKGEKV